MPGLIAGLAVATGFIRGCEYVARVARRAAARVGLGGLCGRPGDRSAHADDVDDRAVLAGCAVIECCARSARARRAGLFAAAAIGALLWAVPLVIVSGGVGAYLHALAAQGAQDFNGIEMLATRPSAALFRAGDVAHVHRRVGGARVGERRDRTRGARHRAARLARSAHAAVRRARVLRRISCFTSRFRKPRRSATPCRSSSWSRAWRWSALATWARAGRERWRGGDRDREPHHHPAAAAGVRERRRAGVSGIPGHASRAPIDARRRPKSHAPSRLVRGIAAAMEWYAPRVGPGRDAAHPDSIASGCASSTTSRADEHEPVWFLSELTRNDLRQFDPAHDGARRPLRAAGGDPRARRRRAPRQPRLVVDRDAAGVDARTWAGRSRRRSPA